MQKSIQRSLQTATDLYQGSLELLELVVLVLLEIPDLYTIRRLNKNSMVAPYFARNGVPC